MAGNVNEQEKVERRQKLAELWVTGLRSMTVLAERLGCNVRTVKRDLVVLRRQARNTRRRIDIEILRLEIDHQYLQLMVDIEPNLNKALEHENYNAVVGFMKLRMELISRRAELWGLVGPGTNIHISAQAESKGPLVIVEKETDLSKVSESDLRAIIELAKRINQESGSGNTNRINET